MNSVQGQKRKLEDGISKEPTSKRQKLNDKSSVDVHTERVSKFQRECMKELRGCVALEIADVIIEKILSLSGHSQVISFWKSMINRLGDFSFMIDPPESLRNIKEFEQKYRNKTRDVEWTIPGMLRVSLLISGGIGIPQIFDHSQCHYLQHENIDLSSIFESTLLPLDQWRNFSESFRGGGLWLRDSWGFLWKGLEECGEDMSEEDEKQYSILEESGWINQKSDVFQETLLIGHTGDEKHSSMLFMNGDELIYYGWFGDDWTKMPVRVVRLGISDFFKCPVNQSGLFTINSDWFCGSFDKGRFASEIMLYSGDLAHSWEMVKKEHKFLQEKHNDFLRCVVARYKAGHSSKHES